MSDDNISDKPDTSNVEMLRRYQTAESVLLPIPRDAFEKLYLNPKIPTAGNLRRTFGNPTPVSLMGFLIAATPAAMQTMGWRGSGGHGGAILWVLICCFYGDETSYLTEHGTQTCLYLLWWTCPNPRCSWRVDPWKYLLLRPLLYIWYVYMLLTALIGQSTDMNHIGTFMLVQGTTQMPFFGVGTNYSSTGNTLEGVQTPEFAATIGPFDSHILYSKHP